MVAKKDIEFLRYYNKWRQGEAVKMPNPKDITSAINNVVDNSNNKRHIKNIFKSLTVDERKEILKNYCLVCFKYGKCNCD